MLAHISEVKIANQHLMKRNQLTCWQHVSCEQLEGWKNVTFSSQEMMNESIIEGADKSKRKLLKNFLFGCQTKIPDASS